jgi:hypothetical protein
MASTPTPHLLTLPREIGNEIYRYLHHTVRMTAFLHVPDWSLNFRMLATVNFGNAPSVAVLATHSQLYDEHKDARRPQAVTASLHMAGSYISPCGRKDPHNDRLFRDVFTHVRHSNLTFSGVDTNHIEATAQVVLCQFDAGLIAPPISSHHSGRKRQKRTN